MIRFYERLAGKLIVRSARLRARRMAGEDAHELRHLWAAINAGNSDGCEGGARCKLDRLDLPNYPSVWTGPILQEDVDDLYGGIPPEGREVV